MKKHLLAAVLAVFAALPAAASQTTADSAAPIRHLLQQTWQKPNSPLHVDPVTVVGEHAVAGWRQGERGGRALLRRTAEGWTVVLCSGVALTESGFLHEAGVPMPAAETLAAAIRSAESGLSAETRAAFDAFEGTVRMEGGTHHAPASHP